MNVAVSDESIAVLVNAAFADGIFHIELNRPEAGNAANKAFAEQLLSAVRRANEESGARVLLISAAGRNFMAGGELAGLRDNPAGSLEVVNTVAAVIAGIAEFRGPVVCAVQGFAAGGGLGLALSADILIAEEGARFTVGSPAIGLAPDAGTTWQLARWVGMRKATEMSLLCTTVDAPSALACGLVTELAAKGGLMELAWSRARQLASAARLATEQTKRLLKVSSTNTLGEQLQAEVNAFALCSQSPDLREGVDAMLGKRKASFS